MAPIFMIKIFGWVYKQKRKAGDLFFELLSAWFIEWLIDWLIDYLEENILADAFIRILLLESGLLSCLYTELSKSAWMLSIN